MMKPTKFIKIKMISFKLIFSKILRKIKIIQIIIQLALKNKTHIIKNNLM